MHVDQAGRQLQDEVITCMNSNRAVGVMPPNLVLQDNPAKLTALLDCMEVRPGSQITGIIVFSTVFPSQQHPQNPVIGCSI